MLSENKIVIDNKIPIKHTMKRLIMTEQTQPTFPVYHQSAKNIETDHGFNDKYINRIKFLRNKKVSANNEHIRIRTVKDNNTRKIYTNHRQERMNFNSLQLPLGMLRQEKQQIKSSTNLQLELNNTATNFINFFIGARAGASTRVRQKTITSFKSINSKVSKKQRQRNSLQNQSAFHIQRMKNLSKYLNQQKLGERLRMFSKQHGKNSIRVYKQDIHKMIVHRFSKDRMTVLLDTQYIQDFNSVLQTMKQMVNLKKSQVLVLTFLIMDQNRDGFISPDDLLSLMGVKKQTPSSFNELLMHDVFKIIQYVQKQKQRGNIPIMDTTTNNILKDQTLTFMKYRMNNIRTNKNLGEEPYKSGLMSRKMKNYLFCLREQDQKLQKLQEKFDLKSIFLNIINNSAKKNKKVDKNQLILSDKENFLINFDRFSFIFRDELPKIFLDFLYLLGGLEVPGQKYMPIDNSVLYIQASEQKKIIEEQDKMQVVRKRLQKMNMFKKQFRVERMKTQP